MKLFVNREYHKNSVEIYMKDEHNNLMFGFNGSHIVQTQLGHEPTAEKIQPLLILPMEMYEDLLRLFANEANELNIRTENENHLKGKLEATEKHLVDMQKAFNKLLEDKT